MFNNDDNNSVALMQEGNVPTERLVFEVSAKFVDRGVSCSQHDRSPSAVISVFYTWNRYSKVKAVQHGMALQGFSS
jgi:hypothetical protein